MTTDGPTTLQEHLQQLATDAEDGYGWIAEARWYEPTFAAVPVWGTDGWDLGRWPLVIIGHARPRRVCFALVEYVERDVSVRAFAGRDELVAATDEMAHRWWEELGTGPGRTRTAAVRTASSSDESSS